MKHRLSLLSTTSIGVTLVWLATASWGGVAHAFDVNDGKIDTSHVSENTAGAQAIRERTPTGVGERRVIVYPKASRSPFAPQPIAFSPLKPGESSTVHMRGALMPPIVFAPLSSFAAAPAPVPAPAVQAEVVPARAPIVFAPLRAPVAAAPAVKRIEFPPVAPEVAARAHAELNTNAPIAVTEVSAPVQRTPSTGHIATLPQFGQAGTAQVVAAPAQKFVPVEQPAMVPLAPLPSVETAPASVPVRHASAPVVNIPVVNIIPAPPVAGAVLPAAPTEVLSRSTKSILSTIPSKLDTPQPGKAEKLSMSRTTPSLDVLDVKSGKKDAYEAAGIKISVSRPGLDTNYELNRAFNAVSGGDNATAMQIYKDILSVEPTNPDALFGLASIYHRQGQLDKARPLYGTLLKNYPSHREGINNFLVLVSDESPQEALAELERLEQRNPDFSPIPAQQALLLERLGYVAEAQVKMARAIELAPDNLTYKYNLAIMLDRQKNYAQAAALYRLLIDASSKGAKIPASADNLQRRLNYIANISGAPVPVIN